VIGVGARYVQRSDLLVGDILLDVAGKPVNDAATLRHILANGEEGKDVPMKILRGGVIVETNIATQTVESGS
jgi:S1-C subfamily serine protease